ncbi:MAG: hypothetical protein ETSY1_32315 [Candidatus Entotheonella factor]|uniref:Methyltransferase domain-containing protein n=1 Tax=Entotheonella factor TaxID=1429438 RepID=W4LCH9_ENTF1|nr:MAG: hypothetical protein ETSY1_32315 [Candidatus Entotheonella factor]
MIDSSIIHYYDEIASSYNSRLEKDARNCHVRNYVRQYVLELKNVQRVMDFGGGTGLDLPWLIENDFDIVFCEPSTKMSAIARQLVSDRFPNASITFEIGASADFSKWCKSPDNQVDVILSNFSALNSIANIGLAFKQLGLRLTHRGHLITVLTHFPQSTTSWDKSRSCMAKQQVSTVSIGSRSMKVYYYQKKHLVEIAKTYFDLAYYQALTPYGFHFYHWIKR